MSRDDLFSDSPANDYASERRKRLADKRISPAHATKLTLFENVHASKVIPEDVSRAHRLFHRIQDKFIKSKITKLFFN